MDINNAKTAKTSQTMVLFANVELEKSINFNGGRNINKTKTEKNMPMIHSKTKPRFFFVFVAMIFIRPSIFEKQKAPTGRRSFWLSSVRN